MVQVSACVTDGLCTETVTSSLSLPPPLSAGQYMQAFRAKPNEPLYNLCIGLTFFHMASQKFVIKRHPLLLQVSVPLSLCAARAEATGGVSYYHHIITGI